MDNKTTKKETLEEERARETWDSWIGDLEDKEQPNTCSIEDEDCEACGS